MSQLPHVSSDAENRVRGGKLGILTVKMRTKDDLENVGLEMSLVISVRI